MAFKTAASWLRERFALGSATAPSITFAGDTNTGLYSPAADSVAIATNSTQRIVVDASGFVGLSQINPSSYDANARMLVIGDPAGGNFGMTIAAGTANIASIHFADGTTGAGPYVGFIRYDHSTDSLAIWVAAAERLRIDSTGQLTTGTGSAAAPVLSFSGDTNTGIYSPGADQVGIATAGTAAVYVGSTGNVGVGTSSPAKRLHVKDLDNTGFVGVAVQNDTNNVGLAGVEFGVDSTYRKAAIAQVRSDANGAGALVFYVDSANDAANWATGDEKMRIATDGKVGIGVTPATRLDVLDTNARLRFDLSTTTTRIINGNAGATAYQALKIEATDTSIIGDGTERFKIDTNGLITGTGTSLGAWTAYTPTLGGTGWAIGNGTATGRYCQIGKIVSFEAHISFGSTSTFGGSGLTISLPVTANGSQVGGRINCQYTDASAALAYLGTTDWPSTTAIQPQSIGTGGLAGAFTTSAPITWATSDVIRVSGTYQAA